MCCNTTAGAGKLHLPVKVMSALERSRQWKLAIAIMEKILSDGVEADHITWNSVVSACESGEQWMQALHMLHRARSIFAADSRVVAQKLKRSANSAISACAKASHWPLSLQLLRMIAEDAEYRTEHDTLCFNSLLLQMTGAHWRTAACLLQEMSTLNLPADLVTQRGGTAIFQEGACHSQFQIHIAQCALELPRGLRNVEWSRQEENAIEVALATSRLRALCCMPSSAERMIQRVVEAPASKQLLSLSGRQNVTSSSSSSTFSGQAGPCVV